MTAQRSDAILLKYGTWRLIVRLQVLTVAGWAMMISGAAAGNLYVSPVGTNDSAGKYPNWVGASTSIQAAVNLATNGDTVWVTNATYIVNEINIGTNILLIGTNGSGDGAQAILDDNNTARCFYLHNTGAVIQGFAVTRGYASGATIGGGDGKVLNGTVRDCIISNCVSTNVGGVYGGGLYISTGLVERCTVISNRIDNTNSYGGGIAATMSVIRDFMIIGNQNAGYPPSRGGGVYITGSNSVIERCLVSSNTAMGGGGLYVTVGAVARDGTSSRNTATMSGGGGNKGAGGGSTTRGRHSL